MYALYSKPDSLSSSRNTRKLNGVSLTALDVCMGFVLQVLIQQKRVTRSPAKSRKCVLLFTGILCHSLVLLTVRNSLRTSTHVPRLRKRYAKLNPGY